MLNNGYSREPREFYIALGRQCLLFCPLPHPQNVSAISWSQRLWWMHPGDILNKDDYKPTYTGWPRNNATTLIVNFKDIINKTELIFILLCGKFIFQQNDTMIINFV